MRSGSAGGTGWRAPTCVRCAPCVRIASARGGRRSRKQGSTPKSEPPATAPRGESPARALPGPTGGISWCGRWRRRRWPLDSARIAQKSQEKRVATLTDRPTHADEVDVGERHTLSARGKVAQTASRNHLAGVRRRLRVRCGSRGLRVGRSGRGARVRRRGRAGCSAARCRVRRRSAVGGPRCRSGGCRVRPRRP